MTVPIFTSSDVHAPEAQQHRVSRSAPREPLLAPLPADERPEEVSVVIVGGGPAGLTSALLLAQRGVDVLLLERRGFTTHFPRAHLLNVRTMEVMHEIGVADDVYALSPPGDEWRRVVWYTSIGAGSKLIGELPAWGGVDDADAYALASPRRFANVPQLRLDRLLWEHADAACPGRIRGRQEVIGIETGDDGAVVSVVDRHSGQSYEVRARYVLAADGGRTCAELVGAELDGPRGLVDAVSMYVSTDLSMWAEQDGLLCFVINPETESVSTGGLLALGPDTWGNKSREWSLGMSFPAGAGETDEAKLLGHFRAVLGLPDDHQVEVHAISHWQFEGVVADRFRAGPVFLLGDAAHRHPPTGGLGLNCAVQDAHNLAWKLAAVLDGHADEQLLDTYQSERRLIAAQYVAHALENAGRNMMVSNALGLTVGQARDQAREQMRLWQEDSPEGRLKREAVNDAVQANAEDFSQINVEAGFHYEVGAFLPDGTQPPANHESATIYEPTTRPGHHLPHVWLERDGERVSTVDVVEPGALTLFTGSVAAPLWREAASRAGDYPITVHAIDDHSWRKVRGVNDEGAVLVRPDRFVAARLAAPDELATAIATVLGGGQQQTGPGEPAEPAIERIRRIADLFG
jgi:2,4-dichlorophenol 6-monooxygenase